MATKEENQRMQPNKRQTRKITTKILGGKNHRDTEYKF